MSISLCGSDVLILILSLLPPKQFFQCKRICKKWEKAIEKHRQDYEISIQCVQRAMHFLTWRDVVHSQKVIRQMERNGNFRYTTTREMKLFIGQQFYFDEIKRNDKIDKGSNFVIECDTIYTIKIIPIGNGFISLVHGSPARIYYTQIDRINGTKSSWLLLEMNKINSIIGVTKKNNIIILCISILRISIICASDMECCLCWFDESKLSHSKDKIECVVQNLPRYDQDCEFYIPYCFGSLDNQICLIYYGHVVKYTFDEKKITNQSEVPMSCLKNVGKSDIAHCFLFFEKEKIYALSCEMGKITTCVSPYYQNKASLSLECNTDPMAYNGREKNIEKAFVINDVLFIQLCTKEMRCFDFIELQKSMNSESLQSLNSFNLPILQGIKFSYDLIESNHSFMVLKDLKTSREEGETKTPLFYLLHLDLFSFSRLNHLSPTPIYPPEKFDFISKCEGEMYRSGMEECHFCLNGIYYRFIELYPNTFDEKGNSFSNAKHISILLFS